MRIFLVPTALTVAGRTIVMAPCIKSIMQACSQFLGPKYQGQVPFKVQIRQRSNISHISQPKKLLTKIIIPCARV